MAFLLALFFWAVACVTVGIFLGKVWWLPELASVQGRAIDDQLVLTLAAAGAVFFVAQLGLGWFIWKYRGRPGVAYHRISGHENAATLIWYRTFPEQSLYRNTGGVGRICLDFWPVLKGRDGRRDWIYNRFPFSSCAQRCPSLQKMTWPGPRGAETTVRFEAFCEGAQEAEAAIVVSDALDHYPDVLGEALAGRCRKVLVDRLNFCRHWDQMQWARCYFHMHHYGWQDLTRRLYDCAAEVGKKLKE